MCACVRVVVCVSALIILGLTLSTSNWQSDTQTHGDISCACVRARARVSGVCACVSDGTTVSPAGVFKTLQFVYVTNKS